MPLSTLATIHLERLLPAVSSNLPGHDVDASERHAVHMSLYGFAPDGLTVPACCHNGGALLPPISPLPWRAMAVSFLWHFPGLPLPGVTRHPDPVGRTFLSPSIEFQGSSHLTI